jgi:L-galactose dehydrogenase
LYVLCSSVHDPEFAPSIDVLVQETLPALYECQQSGKIKTIGITGYDLALQRSLTDYAFQAGIPIQSCLTYCHYTLNDTTLVSSGFMEWAKSRGCLVYNGSPLGMGLFSSSGPASWHPASPAQREAARRAADAARSRGFEISTLALRCALSCPHVASVIFSTAKLEELYDTLRVATCAPTPEEVNAVREIMSTVLSPEQQGGVIGWHGVEVNKYWQKLGKAVASDGLYTRGIVCEENTGLYTFDGTRTRPNTS